MASDEPADPEQISSSGEAKCWSSIGVWGNRRPRCQILTEVVHCRNCDLYRQAGQAIFDKAILPEYIDFSTRMFARQNDAQQIAKGKGAISFRVGREWYAVEARYFAEVATSRTIHRIPHSHPDLLQGVVNINGSVQLSFSLSHILGSRPETTPVQRGVNPTQYTRNLVLSNSGLNYVFPVDEMGELVRYQQSELAKLPETISAEVRELIDGEIERNGVSMAVINVSKLCEFVDGVLHG